MDSVAFTPPPVSSWQGPAGGFTPPPPSSWEGPANQFTAPGAIPGQAEKNQAILARMEKEQTPDSSMLSRLGHGLAKFVTPPPNPIEEGVEAAKAGNTGGVAKAAGKLLAGPIWPAVSSAVSGTVDEGRRAIEAAKAHRFSEAAGHTAAAIVPGGTIGSSIGDTLGGEAAMPPAGTPAARKVGTQIEPPHPSDIAGAVGQGITAVGLPLATKGVIAGARALTKADPAIAMVRAWKPTPSDSGFTDRIPETLSQIKKYTPIEITGNETALKGIDHAIDAHQQAYEAWMKAARDAGVTVPGDSIVKATADAIPDTMWRENPEQARSIVNRADKAYGGQSLTVDQLDRLRSAKNAELDAFYDKAEGKQIASEIAGTPLAVVKSQVEAMREALYNGLDPQGQGTAPRQIKAQQGDIINLRDAALRQRNTIIGQKPVSAGEAIKRGVANVADIPGQIVTGKLGEGKPIRGPADTLIRRAFKAVGPASDLPQPPSVTPGRPLLTTGSIVTPPPPDTSGPIEPTLPSGIPTRNQGIPPERQLRGASPGEKEPLITPPPADTSGIKVTTGEPLRAPVSRQLQAGPSRLPSNADESSAGMPLHAVPVVGADGKTHLTTQSHYSPATSPKVFPADRIELFAKANGISTQAAAAKLAAEGWTVQ